MPNVHAIRSGILDERLIAAEVERHLGVRPTALVQHPTKLPRFVYEATLPGDDRGGDRIIFKAEHDTKGDDAIVLEAWAMERAREAGVPAARVLALDTSEETFPGRYAIFECVPGVALERLSITGTDRARLLAESGRLLRLIHSVRVAGHGHLLDEVYLRTGEVRGEEDDGWLGRAAFDSLTYLERHSLVSREEGRTVSRVLEAHRQWLDHYDDPRLLHGDFDSSHIFVDPSTNTVTGIIDFGDREAGDPMWDITAMGLWDDAESMWHAIEGYAPALPRDEQRRKLEVYALVRLLDLAHRRHEDDRIADAAPLIARIRRRP